MVVLWTDALLWLIVLGVGLAWAVSQRRAVKARWRAVFASPQAICAFIIMIIYLALGLMDSIHFKHHKDPDQPAQVVSLLDKATGYLNEQMELTYSEPLALTSFSESMQIDPRTQKPVWQKSRLHYINADIGDVATRNQHIGKAALAALVVGFVLLAGFWLGSRALAFRRNPGVSQCATRVQWVWWWSLTFMAVFITFVAILAQDFHVLGTDQVGLDVLYKVVKSVRTALIIGLVTTLMILPFALFLGCSAGYFGGWIDDVVQYVYTTISAIPSVLLIAAMVLSLQVYMAAHPEGFGSMVEQADIRLLFLCAVLGLTSWTTLCRMLRGETLKLRELEFVQSARALGSSSWRIIVRHIMPNVMHLVLIALVLDFSQLILFEAVLSYIGVGVDPTTLSWGTLINSARMELAREPVVWWPLLSAFVSMLGLVLAVNVFAESVREAFDPHGHTGSES